LRLRRWWLLLACLAAAGGALCVSASAQAADSILKASPSPWDFGNSDVHFGGGANQNFTIFNDSGPDVTVVTVGLTGADANQFQVTFDGCTNAFLSQGSSCGVSIAFRPSSPGAKAATLELQDSDDGVLDVPITGTGMTGTLTANPNPLIFSTQPYFFGGQTQNVNLQNSNDFSTQTSSASIVGPDAAEFSIAFGQNCEQQVFGNNNSCGIGIGFNPSGPGTFHAELEVTSDSASSPLRVPLQATALNGPLEVVTPTQTDFGAVAIGSSVAQPVTISNHGDFPLQIQQAFLVSGTPGTFPVTGDRCTGQTVAPGSSCQFTVNFQPTIEGFRDGSVIVISNTPAPVSPIGFTGTGVASPHGGAVITGTPAAGSALTCNPVGYGPGTTFSYQWLRDGLPIAGANRATIALGDSDVGARLACRVTAVNSVGMQTVTSPATGATAAADLSRLPGSFVDHGACRAVSVAHQLTVAGTRVAVRYPSPTVLWSPLTLSAKRGLRVSIDGRAVGRGKQVAISPRALSAYANGGHTLAVSSGTASAGSPLLLADCLLAIHAQGGSNQGSAISVSAHAALGTTTITLPHGLTLHAHGRPLGQFGYTQAGHPPLTFPIVGRHTNANDVSVTVNRHRIRVTNLPARTGVIRLSLRRGVLTGNGGAIRAAATVAGAGGTQTTTVPATWFRRGG
jgi:hypothetical protein